MPLVPKPLKRAQCPYCYGGEIYVEPLTGIHRCIVCNKKVLMTEG